MLVIDRDAYVRAATDAMLTGKLFESLADACCRQAAEEAAAKVVQFADWREKLRPPVTLISAASLFALCLLAFLSPAKAQMACPNPFVAGSPCTPVTASATGTTGAISAALPAVAGRTTYICGFYYTGTNATAANPATSVTITGTIGGTMTFGFPTLAAAAAVPNTLPLDEEFLPCIAASAINTAIAVNGPALGAGATLVTATAWGYQL
jgi:hypothetical protein